MGTLAEGNTIGAQRDGFSRVAGGWGSERRRGRVLGEESLEEGATGVTRAGIVMHSIGIGVGSPAGGKIGFADVSLTRELCCSDRPALLEGLGE